MRHREFEVAELSLSSYVKSLDLDPSPFVALPVYPSRQFRHGGVFVNAAAGIEEPADLRGRVIGTPEWQLTAGVWIRGILADRHGVPVDSVEYRTGGQETPGRIEKAAVDLGDQIRIAPIPEDATLSEMLADGRIDALQSPRVPSTFRPGGPVRRLFADPVAAEKEYFTATGIFPIMHVVVVRRDVYERYPWVAQTLTKALHLAKREAMANLYDSSALRFSLPWLIPGLEEARALMGEDFWSYGLEANRNALATFLRYHHEQGLSRRQYAPEELFAPEATEAFVI
jgi:4,5-dihydroxyphthalate decarboxylase